MSYALEIRNPRSWLFIIVVAAAAALRLHALDRFSYWFDEIVHAFWLNGDSAFFWRSIRFDAMHPPLDYLIGRALEMAHPADWTRKLLPVLWGVLAVAGFSRLITRRVGFRAGILAGVLLAFAPFHVRYSLPNASLLGRGPALSPRGDRTVLAGQPEHPEVREWARQFSNTPSS